MYMKMKLKKNNNCVQVKLYIKKPNNMRQTIGEHI